MKKSQSCPALHSIASAPASPLIYKNKRGGPTPAVIHPQYVVVDNAEMEVVESPSATLAPFGVILRAPALQAAVCVLENQQGVSDLYDGHDTADARGAVACIMTPSEKEEAIALDNSRKGVYVSTDPNRAGEILVRVRRSRRASQGLQELGGA